MNLPFKIINNGESGVIQAEKEYFERDCILRVISEYTQNILFPSAPPPKTL